VSAVVFREWGEEIYLVGLLSAPSAGQVKVLLLDVQDDHQLLVFEEIRDDYALTRTGGCGEDYDCWPERRMRLLPNLPTTIPLRESLSRPALATSDYWAKRESNNRAPRRRQQPYARSAY
jgi:hypothetical protein